MADSVLKRVTRYSNNAQISHSTSSLTPVNHVLTDTSNLTKKSKSLGKEEYPVKQIESTSDVKQIEPTADVKQIEHTADVKRIEPTADVKQIEPTADVKEQSSTMSNGQKNDYEIGDIVWAKIGRYPFWPSIVCVDPETNLYIKGSLNEKRTFSLHVRFCNDNGRRSWAKTIENYLGKEDLLLKYPNCLGFIKGSKKQMTIWNLAVKEADGWLKTNREDRVAKFTRTNGLVVSKISGLGPTPSTSKSSVVEKRVASTSSPYVNLNSRDYLRKLMAVCVEGSSVTYDADREASTSDSNTRQCLVDLKNIPNGNSMEQPKQKAIKRKFVDEKKKQMREELKMKKAKRALQVKKYGFSYSSSEFESSDDEAPPSVPFNPTRKVLARIKSTIVKLESKNMKESKERRIKIKAIRMAERNAKKKQRVAVEDEDDDDDDEEEEEEEEEEDEQD